MLSSNITYEKKQTVILNISLTLVTTKENRYWNNSIPKQNTSPQGLNSDLYNHTSSYYKCSFNSLAIKRQIHTIQQVYQ